MSLHIDAPKNSISNIVLMPGDPKRATFIANTYLSEVEQVSSTRGMTGYTGLYKGKRVSVIPSGMGIPSIGIYAHELYTEYDVKTIIRIGTCGTFKLNVFDVILASGANTTSTFAFEYNNSTKTSSNPSKEVNDIVVNTANEKGIELISGNVYTTDAFYKTDNTNELQYDGIEMETFGLFHIASSLNKQAAALLTVSDVIGTTNEITVEQREKSLTKMIELTLESILKI